MYYLFLFLLAVLWCKLSVLVQTESAQTSTLFKYLSEMSVLTNFGLLLACRTNAPVYVTAL